MTKPDATFRNVAQEKGLSSNNNPILARYMTIVDWNNDHCDDIMLAGSNDSLYYFQNTGGEFSKVTLTGLPTIAKNVTAWGDYDHDGDMDVFFSKIHNMGGGKLYKQTSTNTFQEVANAAGIDNNSLAITMALWLDYNNDGALDLFIANGRDALDSCTYRDKLWRKNRWDI